MDVGIENKKKELEEARGKYKKQFNNRFDDFKKKASEIKKLLIKEVQG